MKPLLLAALPALMLTAPLSAEVLQVQPVADGIWALVGPLAQRDAQNLGNNATFGVIETAAGVVLVDPGGSWQGAAMIDATIDTLTDQPVVMVINTGGQDHRWIGNGYWQAQGARVLASAAAVADQEQRGSLQMTMLSQLLGDGLAGTTPAFADDTFDSAQNVTLGGVTFQIRHVAPAHTPGDSFVWLPDHSVMFTGDIVYIDRLLGVGPQSNVRGWIEAFQAMAQHEPAHVVPGHGPATDLATAQAQSLAYLQNLRGQIGALIDAGGDIMDAPNIDQTAWADLAQFDSLAGRNAQATYEEMEWE